MPQQTPKKPVVVSNLSSALANIHITPQSQQQQQQQQFRPMGNAPLFSAPSIFAGNGHTSSVIPTASNSNADSSSNNSDDNNNNTISSNSINTANGHANGAPPLPHQQQHFPIINRQQPDPRSQFLSSSIDIPMSQTPDEPPLDRIALYRKNPPSEGISLFSHRSAPNGFKIAVVLSELGFKYKTFYLDFKRNEQRSPYYLSMNPNARVPAIIDHDNNDHTVWESGSILMYLCQRAGRDCPIWSDDLCEQSSITSWLFFQASGHAPMIGQALHFKYFHPERIGSALERYVNEVRRIYGVVEMRLAELREQMIMEMDDESFSLGTSALSESKYFADPVWLVGNRMTVADLSFVTWNHVVDRIDIDLKNEFPEVYKWTQIMLSRASVKRALSGLESN